MRTKSITSQMQPGKQYTLECLVDDGISLPGDKVTGVYMGRAVGRKPGWFKMQTEVALQQFHSRDWMLAR